MVLLHANGLRRSAGLSLRDGAVIRLGDAAMIGYRSWSRRMFVCLNQDGIYGLALHDLMG